MAKLEFSPEQRDAVYSRGENLLVSAGAGSGKTTVLVERILRYVASGGDITKVLAMTFTNAAAADMKAKLDKAISALVDADPGNGHLREQLSLLPQAQISTIHSFCLEMLRQNYFRVGLTAGFRVAAENDIAILKKDTLLAYMEEAYAAADGGLRKLADAYGGVKDDSGLVELALELYDFCRSRPDPWVWLKQAGEAFAAADLESMPFAADVRRRILRVVVRAAEELSAALNVPGEIPQTWRTVISDDLAQLARVSGAGDLDRMLLALAQTRFPTLRRSKKADAAAQDEAKLRRDNAKKAVNDLGKRYAAVMPGEQLARINALQEPMAALYALLTGFDEAFRAAKKEQGWIDFSDMEFYALELLDDAEVGAEVSSRFEEILIDEYQDINEVQEAILQRLTGGQRLFAVGDVKQSIYRFRLAEPQLFLNKYDAYGRLAGGRRIDLNENFRSQKPVIDGVNFIFSQLMQAETAELDYDEAARLRTGKTAETDAPEFWLIDAAEETERSALEAEAVFVAKRIKELHEGGYAYGDIAVLLRNLKNVDRIFLAELTRENIPTVSDGGTGYLDTPEIELILSALSVIDQPRQDIPLAAVLRSPLADFSPDELVEIRFAAAEGCLYAALRQKAEEEGPLAAKCRAFLQRLESWRQMAGERSVAQLILALYRENGYYQLVGAMQGGKARQAGMQLLLQEAYDYEDQDYAGLFRFVQRLERVKKQKLRTAPPQSGDAADGVHLMSIHKSKGLEFPVVFVSGLAREFNFSDERHDIVWERDAGLGPLLADRQKRRKYATLCHTAVADRLHDLALAEEIRVYYVALTRAKERLILTAATTDTEKRLVSWREAGTGAVFSPSFVLAAKDPLTWLGAAVLRHPEAEEWQKAAAGPVSVLRDTGSRWQVGLIDALLLPRENAAKERFAVPQEEVSPQLAQVLAYRYPQRELCTQPAKWSVSALLRQDAAAAEEAAAAGYAAAETAPGEEDEDPQEAELRREKAARRGTAIHALLEYVDISTPPDKEKVGAALAEMREKGALTEEDAASVSVAAVSRFFRGKLGQRLCAAAKKARELPFTMIDDSDKERSFVIQGIVDAVFYEEGGWVLLDYKTGGRGRSEEELAAYYRPQLTWYRRAVEKLLGGQVRESWLVMLDLGKEIAVATDEK